MKAVNDACHDQQIPLRCIRAHWGLACHASETTALHLHDADGTPGRAASWHDQLPVSHSLAT
eukprot:10953342-Prorocentrum_lima.AAC.1